MTTPDHKSDADVWVPESVVPALDVIAGPRARNPQAARLAADVTVAVMRWLAENSYTISSASSVWHWLTSHADEIEEYAHG